MAPLRLEVRKLRFLILLLIAVSCSGCVRRRMTVRSNPPGAMVYIDDQQIGTTPVSTEFLYYGTRKFRLVKDRYETLTTYQRIEAPWYELPIIEFVSENLVGREIRDERILDFQLKPQRIVPKQELLGRANDLRAQAVGGYIAPSPPSAVIPAGATAPMISAPAENSTTFGTPSLMQP